MSILKKIQDIKIVKDTEIYLKNKTFLGFEGVPVYYVLVFLIRSLKKGAILQYSAAITFNFFLAIFPSIIFIFTLISYIPLYNFQNELFVLLEDSMPPNVFEASEGILMDIINNQHGGLLSFGFFGALFFAANGVKSLIEVFNKILVTKEKRGWIKERLIALLLTIVLCLLIFISVIFLIIGGLTLGYMVEFNIIKSNFTVYLIAILELAVILIFYFFSVSFLYYFGSSEKRSEKRFITLGAFFSTVFSIVSSLIFYFYVNNFSTYNKLYGSIGVLIIFLLWMYINSLFLLLGFEINSCIIRAKIKYKL